MGSLGANERSIQLAIWLVRSTLYTWPWKQYPAIRLPVDMAPALTRRICADFYSRWVKEVSCTADE